MRGFPRNVGDEQCGRIVGIVQRVGHEGDAAGDDPGDELKDRKPKIDDHSPQRAPVAYAFRAVRMMMMFAHGVLSRHQLHAKLLRV